MISLVSTILNDREGLERFFAAMALQSRLPDEIVVVDAGSKDGSWELMEMEARRTDRPWVLQVLQEVRCNCARGRNRAIERARGGIIVSTDIGCEWDPEWLEELVAPLNDAGRIELVIGSWAVRRESISGPWGLTEWALKGDQRLEATAESYSSSRSIGYYKSVWAALGRYPEDLSLAADDAVFHYLIEKANVVRAGAPVVRCYWHRHESLKGFCKEFYRYGLGDGEASIRKRDVMLIGGRLAVEVTSLVLGCGGILCSNAFLRRVGVALLFATAASVLDRLVKLRGATERLRAQGVDNAWMRLIVFIYGTKVQWLRGYAAGFWRGRVYCKECRGRLLEMTPEIYRLRLKELKLPGL